MTFEEIKKRIISLLPPWFDDDNPVRDSLINAATCGCFFIYGLYEFAKLQTRINTAQGIFLDLIAQDFFGSMLMRESGLSDEDFRKQILLNLFREKATRYAVEQSLFELTGQKPSVFEFLNPNDTGAYSEASWGYATAGGYGSMSHPYEAIIYAKRRAVSGLPYSAGYDVPLFGYSTASDGQYASAQDLAIKINDPQIFKAIENVRPVAITLWVNLENNT